MSAYRIQTPDEVMAWAQTANWMMIWANDDYSVIAFLSPAGNIVEFFFERNKVTVKTQLAYSCK